MQRKQSSIEELFWKHVTPGAPDACWEWRGTKNDSGYGVFVAGGRRGRKQIRAHRTSYELHCGPIPAGMAILHQCDNPACVNPAHLRVGTQQDNLADMRQKGRHRSRALTGEQNARAKLTRAAVVAIRAERRIHGTATAVLAQRFNVGETAINAVLRGHTWRHVSDEVR